jgi:polysaccharide pyruvyl transferase WcaK-like protein
VKKLGVFTWSGFGNFGDDLIRYAAIKLFDEFQLLELEERKFYFRNEYKLRVHTNFLISRNFPTDIPLIFLGGGMIATDINASTITRWARHLTKHKGFKYAFGIGVGPFRDGTEKLAHALLNEFESPILVRTEEDLKMLWNLGIEGELACDPVLLLNIDELRLSINPKGKRSHDFYKWQNHWVNPKPFQYHEHISQWLDRQPVSQEIRYKYQFLRKYLGSKDKKIQWALTRYIDLIGNSQSISTSKLHTSITAGLLQVPQMYIPYNHKFDLLLELGAKATSHESVNYDQKFDSEMLYQVKLRGQNTLENLKERIYSENFK